MAPAQKDSATFVPSILVPSSILSMVLSAAVFGLSIVNFGLLSRWYNASVSLLTILLHAILFFLMWRQSRRAPTSSTAPIALVSPVVSEITSGGPTSGTTCYRPLTYMHWAFMNWGWHLFYFSNLLKDQSTGMH
ncbi:hypothetical protein DFP72DRAFT_128474 [Ephemerocybe angulata]|uniref:Uncharacterized protein n=1 Tax=Ephemerocybe angulata TaxID=980116 RepID=A0A8H6HBV7_9AGAR|nr:hypothetical protein DFP72DRAFT_128474 [Tulosesus angulatus]